MVAFTFLPEIISHSTFIASTTNDVYLLEGGVLLSKPTMASEIRIITLSSLFHFQTLKMK